MSYRRFWITALAFACFAAAESGPIRAEDKPFLGLEAGIGYSGTGHPSGNENTVFYTLSGSLVFPLKTKDLGISVYENLLSLTPWETRGAFPFGQGTYATAVGITYDRGPSFLVDSTSLTLGAALAYTVAKNDIWPAAAPGFFFAARARTFGHFLVEIQLFALYNSRTDPKNGNSYGLEYIPALLVGWGW